MSFRVEASEEARLIAAILAGDSNLYHQLIRPYERSVYMMSLSWMKNEEDAKDVAQETFIRAFRKLEAFRGESKFSTWLIGIALNEARNRLRRQATLRFVSFDELQYEDVPVSPSPLHDWRELPSDLVERKDISKLLRQAVEKLPSTYRQVFLLRDIEEFNVNETAEVLDISTSLVKVRLHRARLMLQRLLAHKLKAHSGASAQLHRP